MNTRRSAELYCIPQLGLIHLAWFYRQACGRITSRPISIICVTLPGVVFVRPECQLKHVLYDRDLSQPETHVFQRSASCQWAVDHSPASLYNDPCFHVSQLFCSFSQLQNNLQTICVLSICFSVSNDESGFSLKFRDSRSRLMTIQLFICHFSCRQHCFVVCHFY